MTEGIKFLYAQASETLRRRREHEDKDPQGVGTPSVELARPEILIGKFLSENINSDALDRLAEALRVSTEKLVAASQKGITLQDAELSSDFNLVRRILEAVHGQTITFKGESRAPSGPVLINQMEIDDVVGSATGIIVVRMSRGRIASAVKSQRNRT